MSTNTYFNNFPKYITSEQLLVEDLVIESLKIHGMDCFYLPRRSSGKLDYLFGEDTLKYYTNAYSLEMYLEDFNAMQGEGDFVSKFGLEIRDEMTFLIARRRFAATIPQLRPLEGDLIYVPLVQNFFEITFVEHENNQAMFYTLGKGRGGNVYVYSLKLKQFVFSNEIIETGNEEIDEQVRESYPKTRFNFSNMVGRVWSDQLIYQGNSVQTATARAYIHDSNTNYMDVYRVFGTFTPGLTSVYNSNTTFTLETTNDTVTMDDAFEDIVDNNRIETEADSIIDFSESNPFGEP